MSEPAPLNLSHLPLLLTLPQLARELGVSLRTADKLTGGDAPTIRSVRIGKLRRVRRTDLAEYIDRLRGAAP